MRNCSGGWEEGNPTPPSFIYSPHTQALSYSLSDIVWPTFYLTVNSLSSGWNRWTDVGGPEQGGRFIITTALALDPTLPCYPACVYLLSHVSCLGGQAFPIVDSQSCRRTGGGGGGGVGGWVEMDGPQHIQV